MTATFAIIDWVCSRIDKAVWPQRSKPSQAHSRGSNASLRLRKCGLVFSDEDRGPGTPGGAKRVGTLVVAFWPFISAPGSPKTFSIEYS